MYISFIRCPHDLLIERLSRDYTLCQIEDSDTSYLDTRHDLKNVTVIVVTPVKKNHMESYYHHDDFVFSDDDDQIGRATSRE